ncbi:MAG: isoprenyl transferase [Flavobacteriales bacterium]|nr:isoprenyl transferase [Flavobacteriales bacterium]
MLLRLKMKNSEKDLLNSIDFSKTPNHIAIIMDGNGRWAKKQGMFRTFGHKNAIQAVRNAIEATRDLKIKYLTLYAFSTENWNRPQTEVKTLMSLLASTLVKELNSLMENKVRLRTIGELGKLPAKVQQELGKVVEKTKENTSGDLILALNYGSRHEITSAVKQIAEKVKDNQISIEDISEQTIQEFLYTKEIPDVDLMIRTSGEHRISNFLLWQIAYSELYFTDVLWPDFKKEDLYKAVLNYQNRERRFGKTSEQIV